MRDIGKSFPGVRALDGVSLDLRGGEVHALVGENGAGKSTLMKILAGAQPADTGEIVIDGRAVNIDSPRTAEALGIGMIYQEFNLVPALSAVDNIVLGNEPTRGALLDERAARDRAAKVFAELGITLPLETEVSLLSVAQQQMIEIAKVLSRSARIIVMDEPSAALTDREIDRLFAVIATLKARGAGIFYISHRMEELPRVADRITVLRDGRAIETRAIGDFPPDEIVRAMVGRRLDSHFPDVPPVPPTAETVLEVRDLVRAPAVNGVSLRVRAGEIVGLAGLVGAGRTEIVRAIAGADVAQSGEILVAGSTVRERSPADGIHAGIAFITEDRKSQGLVLGMSVRENVTLAHLDQFEGRDLLIDRTKELAATQKYIEELRIRTPGPEQLVRNLSGGNQQKVVLAKWLLGNAKVFLFDEPTRGIDIGAKAEIYSLMVGLAKGGAAIVMVSSELPEVLGMSHRILVVSGGRIVREFDRAQASPDAIIAAATGAAA
ncbi:MAG TPA: sugar ABC transporter ATP-binding protein [Candidatus Baltobacteraceae bacterium]|jgi:ribose transport system ATP-binding protein|nr:sugar ABC transporter ATP-binding protein [Candidatus Baltobacteraceae bacterium]